MARQQVIPAESSRTDAQSAGCWMALALEKGSLLARWSRVSRVAVERTLAKAGSFPGFPALPVVACPLLTLSGQFALPMSYSGKAQAHAPPAPVEADRSTSHEVWVLVPAQAAATRSRRWKLMAVVFQILKLLR